MHFVEHSCHFRNPVGRNINRNRASSRSDCCLTRRCSSWPQSEVCRDRSVTRGWATARGFQSVTCQRSVVSRAHNAVKIRDVGHMMRGGIFHSLFFFWVSLPLWWTARGFWHCCGCYSLKILFICQYWPLLPFSDSWRSNCRLLLNTMYIHTMSKVLKLCQSGEWFFCKLDPAHTLKLHKTNHKSFICFFRVSLKTHRSVKLFVDHELKSLVNERDSDVCAILQKLLAIWYWVNTEGQNCWFQCRYLFTYKSS